MPKPPSRFPIPRFWLGLFVTWSAVLLFVLFSALKAQTQLQHPVWVTAALALGLIPLILWGGHTLGKVAESRGWIYYRQPRTTGMGAGMVLDLEIWVSGRNASVEQVRHAREGLTEGKEQPGESGDTPEPGKQTTEWNSQKRLD